ncbi:unnamed protein product [Colias eurytheme]|nr:unnamed protein product [Colias eurytheme]
MNTIDIERLIEIVKRYPMLYDTRHEQYNNFTLKTQTWKQIAKELNDGSEVLRIKWKGLKDGYRKYKRFKCGVAPNNKSWHSWCWSENLKFLDNYEIRKIIPKKGAKDKCKQTPKENKVPADEEFVDKNELDAIDYLFTSYAYTFKTFSLRSQCMIKLQMAQVFSEAELAEIESTTEAIDTAEKDNDNDFKIEEDPIIIKRVKMENDDDPLESNAIL